jgi:hypothetical protein
MSRGAACVIAKFNVDAIDDLDDLHTVNAQAAANAAGEDFREVPVYNRTKCSS